MPRKKKTDESLLTVPESDTGREKEPGVWDNMFYFEKLYAAGGIETFFWEIAKKYGKDHDITVVYREADPGQLKRLRELVRCVKYREGMPIRCRKAFFNFQADIIGDVEADETVLIIHGDYKALNITGPRLPLHPKINKYWAVSQQSADAFHELSGRPVDVCYNPLTVEKPRKVLKLISGTRTTAEKGPERVPKLAKALEDAGIPFDWDFYTPQPVDFHDENIRVLKPRLDIRDRIAAADYLVQLSTSEGYSYIITEALAMGTPVIITEMPVAGEMGVVDGENGFILPFDMHDIPVEKIYKGLKKFKYTPRQDRWGEILAPGENTWLQEKESMVTVRATRRYFDILLQRNVEEGEELSVTFARADDLEEKKLAART